MLALVVATVALLTSGVRLFESVSDFVQGIDSAVNEIILLGAASYFLIGWENRRKRRRALRALHVLRSLAHIIDMHQLTKDPEQLKPTFVPSRVSKPLGMTRDQVERYLDYCSEMLSLVGKTAALCAEESRDNVVLETVATIETLTVSLSRKIWQKILSLPPGEPVKRPGVVAEEPASPGV
jgi:hypothetical protein